MDGIEVTSVSYDQLLDSLNLDGKTLLVLDTPYVCTAQGMYASKHYFGMVEFIKLMSKVKRPFIFFSSTRSGLLEYINLIVAEKIGNWEVFQDYQLMSITIQMNYSSRYEDNLVYRF